VGEPRSSEVGNSQAVSVVRVVEPLAQAALGVARLDSTRPAGQKGCHPAVARKDQARHVDGHCVHTPSTAAVVGTRSTARNSWRADSLLVVVAEDLDEEDIGAAQLLGAPGNIRLGMSRCRRSRWMRHDGCS
jgi:hypothetical protein